MLFNVTVSLTSYVDIEVEAEDEEAACDAAWEMAREEYILADSIEIEDITISEYSE